jgi:crotonobetaine/carnitine-CoA ligase
MTEPTLTGALARAAQRWPDKTFVRIDGQEVTYAVFENQVARLATGLAAAGLQPGDRLLVVMTNSLACMHTWFAANRLGVLWAPVNTEFRGLSLAHAVKVADARLAIVDRHLLEPLQAATSQLPQTIVTDELGAFYADAPAPAAPATFDSPSSLLFTSGTTGRSKACVLSHRYFTSQAEILIRDVGLRHDDVLYCPFPFFHADATALTTVPALLLGATAAISKRFSASRFWDEIKEAEATVFDFMGATLAILHKAPEQESDADNPIRVAWGVPLPEWAEEFETRFGLELVTMYGSVEANICVTQPAGIPRIPGACGKATKEFEIQIQDEHGRELPADTPGEVVIRPLQPALILDGYFGNPEATLQAFRGLWFHSGDHARMDADGNLYFIGRINE